MLEKKYFDRMVIMDPKYKKIGIERTTQLVEKGKVLIDKHGREDLTWKLKTEDNFEAAGAFFEYELATDESLYE